MSSFDLHLHTLWSYDAHTEVRDYFRFARKKHTRAIAITDHHLMDGYEDVSNAAAEFPEVGYFSGSEISVNCEFGPIDLVCLNLPRRPTPELEALFDTYRNWQIASGTNASRNFCAMGFPFDDNARLELLKSYRPEKTIAKQGISHVQNGLLIDYCIKNGFCKDRDEYREKRKLFTGMPPYPSYEQTVKAVKNAGGLIFIAHPCGYFLQNDLKRMDTLREMFQLDGIECAHPSIPAELSVFYREYCEKHGMLSSAGSDLHDPVYEEFAIHGEERWLDELMERITLYHGTF